MAKKGKNKVEIKLADGNRKKSVVTPPDMKLYKRQVEEGKKNVNPTNPALLISRLDHPEMIQYGDGKIRLSPRASTKVPDRNLLQEDLPRGVFIKKISVKAKQSKEEEK